MTAAWHLGPAAVANTTVAPAMTPEYASPEQIRGDPITTATDTYSLAVVLYRPLSVQKETDCADSSSVREMRKEQQVKTQIKKAPLRKKRCESFAALTSKARDARVYLRHHS